MPQFVEAYEQWEGRTVVDRDGEKIGKVKEIYEDQHTGKPEWATVSAGLFGLKSHFAPLAGAAPAGSGIQLAVTKDQVKDAPGVEANGELSEQEERHLFEHYGVPYTTAGSTTAQGTPRGAPGSGADPVIARSEQEAQVGTAQGARGRVRLRRYIVTRVQETVPEGREETRPGREPRP